MGGEADKLKGPDFGRGLESSAVTEGSLLLGHAQGEAVVLARSGGELFAIGAHCTHQGAPLSDGLLVDGTVRCPWHHACFSLRNGIPVRPPALKPIDCFRVEERDGVIHVRGKLEPAGPEPLPPSHPVPESIVIVGGGAAGNSAAQTLRREGYQGSITMLSADASPPYDRTDLSKGILAGSVDEASNRLQDDDFYRLHGIDLKIDTQVSHIDTAQRLVETTDGRRYPYGALLLATGAAPVHLDIPGATLPHVHYLRTAADCHALLEHALSEPTSSAKRAVIIGSSFIGLEVAAGLRARKIDVQVVGLGTTLMEKILGPAVGNFLQKLHEDHGVIFHLGTTASTIDEREVVLTNEETLPADLVVIGIGVRPVTGLAEQAGLSMDRGVTVDEYLETSVPGIFAAGDIARWPDPLTGDRLRIEHWVVAERQGQTAARNMIGLRERFDAVPFFWTEQYDFGLAYVGHAERFDEVVIDGELDQRDCTISYRREGRELAAAFIHRDLAGLHKEVEFERSRPVASGVPLENRP
ncbi:MAG TPA: FAD-dependent oxidoreductase [Lysobacter sp.]|nr:FAD-dependent oxidoreductase [Lysobacter sp.]